MCFLSLKNSNPKIGFYKMRKRVPGMNNTENSGLLPGSFTTVGHLESDSEEVRTGQPLCLAHQCVWLWGVALSRKNTVFTLLPILFSPTYLIAIFLSSHPSLLLTTFICIQTIDFSSLL